MLNLCNASRLLLEAHLSPMQGQRFQPTGFADLGAATYTLPNGTRMLLVESAQSMANRLENTIIQPDGSLIPALDGISYVAATLTGLKDGNIETSSLIEAHRLNSPYFTEDKAFKESFYKEAHYQTKQPLSWPAIAKALFKYDINSLLHGIFFSNLEGGRIKMPRIVSSFIEASNVCEVISGGVKNDHIDPTGTVQVKGHNKKGVYGNVPYQRLEYTAENIVAYFNVDVHGIRTLGLAKEAQDLLFALALYKIRALLDGGLRLRTACALRLVKIHSQSPEDFALPPLIEIETSLQASIRACKDLFASPPVTRLKVPADKKKQKDNESGEDA